MKIYTLLFIGLLLAFNVNAQGLSKGVPVEKARATTVTKLDTNVVEVRKVIPDEVKTYDMVGVNNDIQALNANIEATATWCETTITDLNEKRDALAAVYEAPAVPLEPVKEPVDEPVVSPITSIDNTIYNP